MTSNYDGSLKSQVMESLFWLGSLKYIGQIITWVATIFVMRLLAPSDYGLMAMSGVVINFLTLISEFGFGTAIIQKEVIDDNKLNSLFGFLLLAHGVLAGLLWLGASILAGFYSEPRLTRIVQACSINFVLISFYIIPQSILIREMSFRNKSIIDLLATLVSSAITLVLALEGQGVWALVLGGISMHLTSAVAYNSIERKLLRPRLCFREIREFFEFGSFVTGSRILWYVYEKTDVLIGGRVLAGKVLGNYAVALEISAVPLEKFLPILGQVALPAYSKIQSDPASVGFHFLRTAGMVSLVIFPLYGGLSVIAPELVTLLLSTKWSGVIIPIQILCLVMPIRSLYSLFTPALIGIGRPEVSFRNVAAASIIMPLAFLIGVNWGLIGLCVAWLIGFIIVFFFVIQQSLKIIGPTVWNYLQSIMPPGVCGIIMTIVLLIFRMAAVKYLSPLPMIFLSILLGGLIYLGLIWLFYRAVLLDLLNLFPGFEKRISRYSGN